MLTVNSNTCIRILNNPTPTNTHPPGAVRYNLRYALSR